MKPPRIFLGWSAEEMRAWNVAQVSARARSQSPVRLDIDRITMSDLRYRELYTRPTTDRGEGHLWDELSGAPMSTAHAIARFFVPMLCHYSGWALFTDGDVLFRDDVLSLFALADERYAVQVVQHPPLSDVGFKKDGHLQTTYARKNWSSVMLFNCGHPANLALEPELLNTAPGRDLHRFCWLSDDLIGALPMRWNYLVGVSAHDADPAIVHFTEGTPDVNGYEHCEYADEWYEASRLAGYRLERPPKEARIA
jgi:hypothetical protein